MRKTGRSLGHGPAADGQVGTAEPSGREEAHLGVWNLRTKAGESWLS